MPASFPASVKTFTTKLDGTGNPINAAHINDIQDEVNAIEAGYLNATARLNSSASTLASLSVTGGSTFTNRPIEPPPDSVRAELGTTNAMGSSANSTLSFFNNEYASNSSIHTTAAGVGNQRFIPQSTGVYLATAQVGWSVNSSGARQVIIEDSSATVIGATIIPATINPVYQQTHASKRFDVTGGYFVCHVNQDGAASTLSNSTGYTWFQMTKL